MDLNSPMVAIPLFAALFFLVVGNPVVYMWTDQYLGAPLGLDFLKGTSPTRWGLIAHAVVMFIGVHAYLKSYAPETMTSTLGFTPSSV